MTDLSRTIAPKVERLHELFTYDPEAGELRWKKRDRNLTGKLAGAVDPGHGYRRVRVDGPLVLVHRIAIAMTTGKWPEHEVDHINGVRDDNRLENLRCVSREENLRNKARYQNNSSGCTGVSWHLQHRKWAVQIMVDGANRHVGLYHNLDRAIQARKAAELKHGYHDNHGRA